jgi:hypothetical protein
MQRFVIVLAYLGSQCTRVHAACWIFYLDSSILPDPILLRIRQRNIITFCANLGRSNEKTLTIFRQASGEKAWAVHGNSKRTETKECEAGVEQSQEHVHQ